MSFSNWVHCLPQQKNRIHLTVPYSLEYHDNPLEPIQDQKEVTGMKIPCILMDDGRENLSQSNVDCVLLRIIGDQTGSRPSFS